MSWCELCDEEIRKYAHSKLMYEQRKEWALNAIKRGNVIRNTITKFCSINGKIILDIGSGEGGISIAFSKGKNTAICAVDIDPKFIARAKVRSKENKINNISFSYASGLNLPFRLRVFDVIICNAVIEHVPKPQQLINNAFESLKKGGFFYISGPNNFSPYLILRDPHMKMFGVSLLTHRAGKFYVSKIRKICKAEDYDIYGPFSYWLLKNMLKGLFRIVDCHREILVGYPTLSRRLRLLIHIIPDNILKFLVPEFVFVCEARA